MSIFSNPRVQGIGIGAGGTALLAGGLYLNAPQQKHATHQNIQTKADVDRHLGDLDKELQQLRKHVQDNPKLLSQIDGLTQQLKTSQSSADFWFNHSQKLKEGFNQAKADLEQQLGEAKDRLGQARKILARAKLDNAKLEKYRAYENPINDALVSVANTLKNIENASSPRHIGAAVSREVAQPAMNATVALMIPTVTKYGRKTAGSGFAVSPEGTGKTFIVTADHILRSYRAETFKINTRGGKTYTFSRSELTKNKKLHRFPDRDLAIIELPPEIEIPSLNLRYKDRDIQVGEEAIAVGMPYGYKHTVTKGIISGLGREIELPSRVTLTDLPQTDIGVNPGNSGGPIISIDGNDVIGMAVALRDGAQNLNFILPHDQIIDGFGKIGIKIESPKQKQRRLFQGMEKQSLLFPEGRPVDKLFRDLELIKATRPPIVQRHRTESYFPNAGIFLSQLMG